MHTLRGLAPARSFWRDAQFDTLRLALIKVAARVTEMATRIKVALPSCYPYKDSLYLLSARAAKLPPSPPGQRPPPEPVSRNLKPRQSAPSAPPKRSASRGPWSTVPTISPRSRTPG